MTKAPEAVRGAQKAAALLLGMDREVAAEVLRHMDRAVVAEVAAAMGELAPELAGEVDGLWLELARVLNTTPGVRASSDEELHSILAASFDAAQADEVLQSIHARRREQRPFAFLEEREPTKVAAVLAQETPGVVALVLTYLRPELSATVLAALEDEPALTVVRRMADCSPPGPEILAAVADTLRERVLEAERVPEPRRRDESIRTIADMLNHADQEVESSVMEGIEDEDEALATGIRECMFTWADLATVDKRAMQKILASVDTRTLAVSLKGSAPEVQANIEANLSARVKEMVKDERELAGAVPMQEVDGARAEVMKGVRALMDSGEFRPSRSGEDLVA